MIINRKEARTADRESREIEIDENGVKVVFQLAVLPSYRTNCINEVRNHFGDRLKIYASESHLDASVKSGIPKEWYTRVALIRFKIGFIQLGSIRDTIAADIAVVDLNPRSLSAVLVLVARKLLRRPTIAWGHINPQSGPTSATASIRRAMRRLAASTVSYTYRDQKQAQREVAGQPVFVAPNSIYRSFEIKPADESGHEKNVALYVGRLENEKKPQLILEALALVHKDCPAIRVRLVGAGSQRKNLELLAHELGVREFVRFDGWVDQVDILRDIYSTAFCSLSPGFAGLGLTQSLGFGVPMLISRNEPHSPEIELAEGDAVQWFASNDAASLAIAMKDAWEKRGELPLNALSASVRDRYSAEAMAAGLIKAIEQTSGAYTRRQEQPASRSVIPSSVGKIARSLLRILVVRGPVKIGRNFRIGLGARVHATHGLVIGHDVAIGPGSAVQVNGTIGNFVMIGMHVEIVGKNDHNFDEPCQPMRYSTWIGDRALTPQDEIRIEDDVWVGASSVILSGITIGEGSIVAAGSVVTRDVEPYSIVAGNPARQVRSRFKTEAERERHEAYLTLERTR